MTKSAVDFRGLCPLLLDLSEIGPTTTPSPFSVSCSKDPRSSCIVPEHSVFLRRPSLPCRYFPSGADSRASMRAAASRWLASTLIVFRYAHMARRDDPIAS